MTITVNNNFVTELDDINKKNKVQNNTIFYKKKIGKGNKLNFNEFSLLNSSKPESNNKIKKSIPLDNRGRILFQLTPYSQNGRNFSFFLNFKIHPYKNPIFNLKNLFVLLIL